MAEDENSKSSPFSEDKLADKFSQINALSSEQSIPSPLKKYASQPSLQLSSLSPLPNNLDSLISDLSDLDYPEEKEVRSFKRIPHSTTTTKDGQNGKDFQETRFPFLLNPKDQAMQSPDSPTYDPRTLHIPQSELLKLTPFERQFWTIKKDLMDTIVFFKKGKFYELYEEDADIGTKLFDLKQVERVNMRMVGVPEASYTQWATRFLAAGYKIARVDQVETSVGKKMREKEASAAVSKKDKIIERELTCILTNGTISDPSMLRDEKSSFLMAIVEEEDVFSCSMVDLSTSFRTSAAVRKEEGLETLLLEWQPKEILIEKSSNLKPSLSTILPSAQVVQRSLASSLTTNTNTNTSSSDFLLFSYLKELKLEKFLEKSTTIPKDTEDRMEMDHSVLESIDLIETNTTATTINSSTANSGTPSSQPTLYGLLKPFLRTAGGRRLLHHSICHPLQSSTSIKERQQVIKGLSEAPELAELSEYLQMIPDLDRLIGRLLNTPKVKDFISFYKAVILLKETIIPLYNRYSGYSGGFGAVYDNVTDNDITTDDITKIALTIDLPNLERRGYLLPEDEEWSKVVEEEEEILHGLEGHLKEVEEKEGCPIKYVNIGRDLYCLELKGSVKPSPTSCLMLESKTKDLKRYSTPFIRGSRERLSEIMEIKQRMIELYFCDHVFAFMSSCDWRALAQKSHLIDYMAGIASFSRSDDGLTFPVIEDPVSSSCSSFISIKGMKHPLIRLKSSTFIDNDVEIGTNSSNKILLLTGPNMGGKSTLLKQVALAVVMAQMGLPTLCTSMQILPFNHIFTRLGGRDDLRRGRSTFMVEMMESSKIIRRSTNRSLFLMDELGRGTSTKDGIAIARSVLDHLLAVNGSIGIFTTHYSSMVTEKYRSIEGIRCGFMSLLMGDDGVTFLYKLKEGVSPGSFGINVARMAKLPPWLIKDAIEGRDR